MVFTEPLNSHLSPLSRPLSFVLDMMLDLFLVLASAEYRSGWGGHRRWIMVTEKMASHRFLKVHVPCIAIFTPFILNA